MMALTSNCGRVPRSLSVLCRPYAAQAAARSSAQASAQKNGPEIKMHTLDNGLRFASVESSIPGFARIGLLVKAGSRYENYETQGASHGLQMAAGLATRSHSAFAITRHLQQLGTQLECQQGRDYVLYSANFNLDRLDTGIDYFLEGVAKPAFKPWELSDSFYRMEVVLKGLSHCEKAVELLHKAAFRDGLGNSIYTPEFMVGQHKAPLLQGYFNKHVTSHRTALVGLGVGEKVLAKYATLLELESGQGDATKSNYYGGESRLDLGGPTASVCLFGQAAGINNLKEAVAFWALESVLSEGPKIPYRNAGGKLAKALAEVSDDVVCARAVYKGYSDAGLIGIEMKVVGASAGKAIESVAATLRSLSISQEDLAAARKNMTLQMVEMRAPELVQLVGEQALFNGEVLSMQQIQDAVNAVSLGEVQAASKKAFGGKLTLSSAGNLSTVPYLDTL